VWLPAYLRFWGRANLLHLCGCRAVILACAGLWWGSSLLISSQAVSSLAAGIFGPVGHWLAAGHWSFSRRRNGITCGTRGYRSGRGCFPAFTSSSTWCCCGPCGKSVTNRRALALQAAIAAGLFVASRFLPAGFNMNLVYQDPLFHRSWGPAPCTSRDFCGASGSSIGRLTVLLSCVSGSGRDCRQMTWGGLARP